MANLSNTDRIDSVGTTLTGSEGINQKGPYNSEGYNTFNRSRKMFSTFRFADIKPHFCLRLNSGDVVRYTPSAQLRNVKLPQPLLTRMQAHNTVIQVPKEAICPRSFEYQIVPEGGGYIGDDIPNNAYTTCNLNALISPFVNFSSRWTSFNELVHAILYLEMVCSHDSLLANLGYSYVTDANTFKEVTGFDTFEEFIVSFFNELRLPSNEIMVELESASYSSNSVIRNCSEMSVPELRDVFEKIATGVVSARFYHPTHFDEVFDEDSGDVYPHCVVAIDNLENLRKYIGDTEILTKLPTIDFGPLYAYQMAIAQYFTNDKIDSVHSAKEWLDGQESIYQTILQAKSEPMPVFSVNGRFITYDVTSQLVLHDVLLQLKSGDLQYWVDDPLIGWRFMYNIFAYQKSLKYVADDMFGSCRVRPLANGDVTAVVDNGRVSAVDMNKALWTQRFLNAVNRASSDVYKYLRDIFGVEPQRKIPMPYLLMTESYKIDSNEVTNTGTDTGSQASILVTSGIDKSKYYDIYVDTPSYLIGLLSFTQETPMVAQVHGELLRNTRDELFNPMFQHFGDQAVALQEYRNSLDQPLDFTFGYQQRFSEYKFPYSTVSGAFRGSLCHWLCQDNVPKTLLNDHRISPDEIRNQNLCFDQVTTSAINPTLSEYFHFLGVIDNSLLVNSKMQKYTTLN